MLMKKNAFSVIAAMALSVVPLVAEAVDGTTELLRFNQNSYVGWTYSVLFLN